MTASDPIVAYVTTTDGQRRPVFEDADGQYDVLDDGEAVRGVWYIPHDAADESFVAEVPQP